MARQSRKAPEALPQHFEVQKRQMRGRNAPQLNSHDVKGKGKADHSKSGSSSPPPPIFCDTFLEVFRFTATPDEDVRKGRIRHVSPSQKADVDHVRSSPRLRKSSIKIEAQASQPIKSKKRSKKAAPDADIDEHLPQVPDYVKDGMDVLFIGSNPGRMSSQKGQHFGHPSNHFYRALHGGGFTPELVPPSRDYTMLDQQAPYMSLGLTNLAPRPTRLAEEVHVSENEAGAVVLSVLIRRHRPRVGIFVGLGVARAFEQASNKIDAKLKKAVKAEGAEVDEEDYVVTLPIPASTPLSSDKELGLGVGLLPIALRHRSPIDIAKTPLARVKKEDEDEDDKKVFPEPQILHRQPPFTLLYACPSTSGRVTTHQLPQKTEVMRRARLLAQYLAQMDGHDDKAAEPTMPTKTVQVRLI